MITPQQLAEVSESDAVSQVAWLTRLWAAAFPLLMAVTWPLWAGVTPVPAIPALGALSAVLPFVDFVLLAAVAWGAASVLRGRVDSGLSWGLLGLAGLLLLDQLRWQPWAYHLLLLGVSLRFMRPASAIRLLRPLAVSVYLYSAIAKLDYAFASTLGRQMVDAAFGVARVDSESWRPALLLALALAMPVTEAIAGLLLIAPRTRRVGVVLAAAMHLGAILALGPAGLGHRPGVLVWNLVFLAHTWLLFWPLSWSRQATAPAARAGWASRGAAIVVVVAILGPLSRPAGFWDRWPSWGLYAPGGERTELYVHRSGAARLPGTLPLGSEDAEGWRRLRLDEWSLAESLAPLYPQRRTTLAIALELQNRSGLSGLIRVDLLGPADRFTGERSARSVVDAQQLQTLADSYWLGVRSRQR